MPDFQLSLAIGKEGQNARLAHRLTGWRIDIKSETQKADEAKYAGDDWAQGEWIMDKESGDQMWQPADGSPAITMEEWEKLTASAESSDGEEKPAAEATESDSESKEASEEVTGAESGSEPEEATAEDIPEGDVEDSSDEDSEPSEDSEDEASESKTIESADDDEPDSEPNPDEDKPIEEGAE